MLGKLLLHTLLLGTSGQSANCAVTSLQPWALGRLSAGDPKSLHPVLLVSASENSSPALHSLSPHTVHRTPTSFTCHTCGRSYPPSPAFFSASPLGDRSTHDLLHFIFFGELKDSLLHHPNAGGTSSSLPTLVAAPLMRHEVRRKHIPSHPLLAYLEHTKPSLSSNFPPFSAG